MPGEIKVLSPSRGIKRKARLQAPLVNKKSRRLSPTEDARSDDLDHSDYSDLDTGYEEEAFTETPSTPVSIKPSPRFPSQLKTINCPHEDCDKSFNRPARLQEHLRSHTNTRIFLCPQEGCGKDFLRQSHLDHHVKSAHTSVREYVCNYDGCGKSFVTNTRLKRHHAAHEGREKHMCDICKQSFRKHATLHRHTLTVHEGKAAFICDEIDEDGTECGMGFETAGKLKSHRGREHGTRQYQCTICVENGHEDDTQFPTYTDLQSHNRVVHPPTCMECSLTCGTAKELRRHLESEHGIGDPKPVSEAIHVCPQPGCGKSFTKKGNLSIHLKSVHSDKKQFVCGSIDLTKLNNVHDWDGSDPCGRGFTAKATLEEHIRTHHLGLEHSRKKERQLKNAKAEAAEPSALDLLTGTGYNFDPTRELPCLVPGCSFMFVRNYDRDLHLRARHGLGDFEVHMLQSDEDSLDGAEVGSGADVGGAGPALDLEDSSLHEPQLEDSFWIGGYSRDTEDEWDADEAAMRDLIDDDLIDPSLQ